VIVVTGTKRSGTSMWMQVLGAAGLPVVGDAFPADWEARFGAMNPKGFFESSLRGGINFRTNPDPRTGVYLHPGETRRHCVKVFLPGLVRTDHAFLDRVIVTVRDWRSYVASASRLYALEGREGGLAPALEWWVENYLGLRDVLTRRYPCHFLSYASVLRNPRGVVREVLGWVGGEADAEAAAARVDVSGRDDAPPPPVEGMDPIVAETFDLYYQHLDEGRGLSPGFLTRLQNTHEKLLPLVAEYQRASAAARNAP